MNESSLQKKSTCSTVVRACGVVMRTHIPARSIEKNTYFQVRSNRAAYKNRDNKDNKVDQMMIYEV